MPLTTSSLTVRLGSVEDVETYQVRTTPPPEHDALPFTVGPCILGYRLSDHADDLREYPDGTWISQYCHRANLHSYFRGEAPEDEMDQFRDGQTDFCTDGTLPNDTRTVVGRLRGTSWLFKVKSTGKALPIVITETGYSFEDPGEDGVPTDVGETYIVRACLEYFRIGIARFYFFQLYDDQGEHYGMFNPPPATGISPRGVATGLHKLTGMIRDTGANRATFTTTPLTMDVTGPSGKRLRWQLFQKSDMSWWLALWRPDSIWSRKTRQRLTLTPARIDATVSFNSARRAVVFPDMETDTPSGGDDLGSKTSHTISVGSRVTWVKIT